ncbi:MAG: GNAT family N-acetyltransferase [Calothrix sp. C42_A2020_038]|nr:GNAT family N-acetyltransferase [Calothrix sp. C42_A2020_038]
MNTQILEVQSPTWIEILQLIRHDIYHLPEYVILESQRTNSHPEAILIIDGEKIFFLPYLLRRCHELFDTQLESEIFDVTSPYGYPGILLNQAARNSPEFLNHAIASMKSTFRDKKVCSAFFRLHPILNKDFDQLLDSNSCRVHGETVSVNVEITNAEIWQQTRNDHRTKINWCKRAGMIAKMVSFQEYIDEFIEIYEETMNRVGASNSYYFDYNYFLKLASLADKIHLCVVEWEGQITCAGLFTECCGIVQFHLSGTRNKFLKQAPSKLMLDYVRYWAKERGNKLFHLGGGVGSAKDSLYEFKAGFSKIRHNFMTFSLITNEEIYDDLVKLRAKSLNLDPSQLFNSTFFPAYRF